MINERAIFQNENKHFLSQCDVIRPATAFDDARFVIREAPTARFSFHWGCRLLTCVNFLS
jgi:hypothetical protein